MIPFALVPLLASLAAGPSAPGAGDESLAQVSLLRLDGAQVDWNTLAGDGVVVVTYTGVGCPISGKYAPRLERLHREYGERGVRFLGINANPQDTREEVAQEARELGLTYPVLKDFRQQLTRATGVETTTEVLLFDADGELRYQGAVDDQYSLGASKPAPTTAYLVEALEAVLAGEAPKRGKTEAPGCKITLLPEAELPEAVTWSRDVAPILRRNCEVCHRPGQVGPFTLQTYEEARGWGAMIASVVEEERMPPWNAPARFHGVFANERRLSGPEKQKILRWFEDGMPQGDPAEAPAPATWPEGWRIGEPDAVFSMERWMRDETELPEEGFAVPREGVVDYKYFVAQTNFEEDRWVQAVEIRPGAADVVHHVLVIVQEAGSSKGFGRGDFLNHLAVAVPGDTPSIYPDGYAKRLPAGARLVFQLHYTPNGKERFDRSSIGLIFADEEPVFEVMADAIVEQRFRIPAGAKNHEVRSTMLLEEDTGFISLFPHMHSRGKDFRYTALYPDGREEELFSDYDFNWQESYLYHDPKFLPAGTRIECVGHFDNSSDNPGNPDPEVSVTWGEQTFEEMFVGYFEKVVPLED